MIATGEYFEKIVEMLNNFRFQVQAFDELGLLNINKHSEGFVKRLLNLTYEYDLQNLNNEATNFPGLDLGDRSRGIAFQITSTKTSEKVNDTLEMCLKFKHYQTFRDIKVFILTSKQGAYTIKINTDPHFTFTPEDNIWDFKKIISDIQHLGPVRMKIIHDFLLTDLQPTLDSIKNDKPDDKKRLLDINSNLAKTGMSTYAVWQSKVIAKHQDFSVPELYTMLNTFLPTPALKNLYLPMLNPALSNRRSNKEILYIHEVMGTGISNEFYGFALLIEPSSLTCERVNYTNHQIMLNMAAEMLMLLTQILFFRKHSKKDFEVDIIIGLRGNTDIYFEPRQSFVKKNVFNTFKLEENLEIKETLTNTETSTLSKLFQKIMHGFTSHDPNFISTEPFITIDTQWTEEAINNIKSALDIPN